MKKRATTSFGSIAYVEAGDPSAPPVLFVHGIPTSSYLWRHVIADLRDAYHCHAPDLMGLGDTEVDPNGRFDMEAQADNLLELMTALGHEKFALVCHDQGGAAAQLIAARHPERLTCFVLANCVCYDNWPVPLIKAFQERARKRPLLAELIGRSGLTEWIETRTRFSNFKKGVYDPDNMPAASIREYLRPMRESRAGRERFKSFLLAGDCRWSMEAVPGLKQLEVPTLVVWAADDRFLSPSWGKQLFDDIPGARRFELVPFCGHFWQEERPEAFSRVMRAFFAEHLKLTRISVSA